MRFKCEPDLIKTRIESRRRVMSSTVISSRSAFVSIQRPDGETRKLENVVSWALADEDSSFLRWSSEPKQVKDFWHDILKSTTKSYRVTINDGGRHVARTQLVGPVCIFARFVLFYMPVVTSLSSIFLRESELEKRKKAWNDNLRNRAWA